MSTLTLTRDDFSKLAKIDTTGLSHTQKLDAFAKAIGYESQTALMGWLKSLEKTKKSADAVGSEALITAAQTLLKMRKSILADVSSAHSARGPAASGWMREDDRDFFEDLENAFKDLEAAIDRKTADERLVAGKPLRI